MGCFSACFRHSRRRKPPPPPRPDQFPISRLSHSSPPESNRFPPADVKDREATQILKMPDLDSADEQDAKLSESGRKKVTFDLHVKVYQDFPATDKSHGNEEKKEGTVTVPIKALPNNYRYQNCRDSDDEELDDDDDDSVYDYMGDDEDDQDDEEDKDNDIRKGQDSVLNPIENLTQWKSVQARTDKVEQTKNKAKENKESAVKRNVKEKVTVETSLSSWLSAGEGVATTTSKSRESSVSVGNSPCSGRRISPKEFEDRPILGVLTVDDIRQFSAGSTPRRSPSRSPDDMPIIGSVGSYWK